MSRWSLYDTFWWLYAGVFVPGVLVGAVVVIVSWLP